MQDTPTVEVAPVLLTPEQAAAYLATTEKHIRTMCNTRSIPYVLVGRRRRLRKADLDLWIERNVKGAHA